ncbi:MAG: hypothetical protein A2284_00910 [Deltaproteobacteria bacterium RIFOXYA12_FULL_61_11]|nr:MAG: hypothetical protein A2284_00910 [Deltaproteobacteria bacterium RIFOXYA12_FULL_61_11]
MSQLRDELQRLELGLFDALEAGVRPSVEVLAFGETSATLALRLGERDFACTRLAAFRSEATVERYRSLYEDYRGLLVEHLRLHLPEARIYSVPRPDGFFAIYEVQPRFPRERLCKELLLELDEAGLGGLLLAVLGLLGELARLNHYSGDLQVGLDVRFTNWYLPPGGGFDALGYLGLGTPLIRRRGRELLEPDFWGTGLPPGLPWFLRRYWLRPTLDQYYRPRTGAVILLANLIEEHRSEALPGLLIQANAFLAASPLLSRLPPVTLGELHRRATLEAWTRSLLRNLRAGYRGFLRRVLHRGYQFFLPDDLAS